MMEVVFQYQDKTKRVEKEALFGLKRYRNEYSGQDTIILSDSIDFVIFSHFIDFVVSGCVPSHKDDQIGVINLLKEWESNFSLSDSFRYRLSTKAKDGIIIYNGKEYPINIGCLFLHCEVFRQFYKCSSGMVFRCDLSYSQKAFETSLDLIHNKISFPNVEIAGDVYDICSYLQCDSLCQLLNDESHERVLSILIQKQNDDHFDFSIYEKTVARNIESYLKNPSFYLVSLASLCRIFSATNQTITLSSLEPFMIDCMKHHGASAKILLNSIKFPKPSDFSELNKFLQIMSINDTNDIFNQFDHALSEFQSDFLKLQEMIIEKDKIIKDQKKEIENKDVIIEDQKKEIENKDVIIEDQKKEIKNKDVIIEDQKKEIENKNEIIKGLEKAIEEKNKEINCLKSRITELEQRIAELDNLINELIRKIRDLECEVDILEQKIVELQKEIHKLYEIISEKNLEITMLHQKIMELENEIQVKKALIEELLVENRVLKVRTEYSYFSDLFSGIFDGLSKKIHMNLAESGDVDVTASSVADNSYGPKNVLKNDKSCWYSQNIPNSWIQFDFKQRKVSIASYSMNDRYKAKSWKVEGSTDGLAFEIIDNKADTTDFRESEGIYNDPSSMKNFPVQQNNKYYRYIRITSTGKNWNNTDFFTLIRVEFFGFVISV